MHALTSETQSVLIVDNDPVNRAALTQTLQRGGFAAEAAAGGREALARLTRARFSLVVTELKVPDVTGLDVLRAVQRLGVPVPVIVMTAEGSVENAVEVMQAGACDYLLKPFAMESFEASVRKALQTQSAGEAPLSPRSFDARVSRKTLVTQDARLLEVLALARQVARSTATILIQGESGTGKELLAAFIHRHGLHPEAPYVAVNCAALPDTLAESELFGHEKGAFTGAVARKIGKFELARKGTIVLDEIGETSLSLQAKLLRVLQEREIDRVGGGMPTPIEARVVVATNRDLASAVAAGSFREDLFYRINVVPLRIPPLRERSGDVLLLAHHFLDKFNSVTGKRVARISAEALDLLSRNPWKGNVRELENTLERAVLLADGDTVLPRHLQLTPGTDNGPGSGPQRIFRTGITVMEMERELIMGTLSHVNQNRTQAAELLGISIRTLRNKLKEYRENGATTAASRNASRENQGRSDGTKIASI
ncbi:MAG TPA: sigma-54 dependent transcriptional regulator [Desulfobacterales bacterium]|nr:sigma-54 dependent transcriptional regulator [Desulfobacterales bacterium]